MTRFLSRAIKNIAARCGVVMFKRTTGLYLPEDEMPRLVQRLCGKTDPLIVDGGAHKGDFVRAIRSELPHSRFVCFEPAPQLVSELSAAFAADPDVIVVAAALGDKAGSEKFHLNTSLATNSLLPGGEQNAGALRDLVTTQAIVDVEVTTLDTALARLGLPEVDIIKLDLQGYDFRALQGATRSLEHAAVVVVEVWFAPIYADAADYLQVCAFMNGRGFSLFTLTSLHYGSTDRLLWGDAVFVRRDSAAWSAPIVN